MKRHIITAFLGLLLFWSCFDDKGNYNYREINQTTIGKLAESYTVAADVGVLHIEPEIKMSMADPDDDRFDYLWIVKYTNYSTIEIVDTIGRERVLDWQADLPIYTYDMWLKVEDTQTGMVTQAKTQLSLTIYHGRGIMLASEDAEGYFKGQMLVMMPGEETVFYDNVLEYSGLPQLRGAVDFFHTGNNNPDYTRAVWIVTESGTYFVNRLSLKMEDNFCTFDDKTYFKPEIPLRPIDIGPRIKDNKGDTGGYNNSMRFVLCDNGDIFHSWMSIQGDIYDLPVSMVDGEGFFKAKAPLFFPHKDMGFGVMLCYDGDNERFLSIGLANTEAKKLADNAGEAFPWNQNGRAYVYGENTLSGAQNGYSFAIMKETTADAGRTYDYSIYEFYVTGPVKRAFYEVLREEAPLFGSATSYAFSSKRTVVFYVAGGKLYAYDFDPAVQKNYEIALADNHEVTMAKFDIQREPGSDFLYVATYNSSAGGTLYKYALDPDLNLVKLKSTPEEQWSGLGKVKNMSWRGSE